MTVSSLEEAVSRPHAAILACTTVLGPQLDAAEAAN